LKDVFRDKTTLVPEPLFILDPYQESYAMPVEDFDLETPRGIGRALTLTLWGAIEYNPASITSTRSKM